MVKKEVVVNNENGLHARPASEITKIVLKYNCEVNLLVNGKIVNAKSPLMIMAAGIQGNTKLEIQCNGEKEEEVLEELVNGFETNFEK